MQSRVLAGRLRGLAGQAKQLTSSAAALESQITLPNGKQLPVAPEDISLQMPAEWAPHAGCWMAWPRRPDVWRSQVEPAKRAFTEVITAIARFEPVTVLAHPKEVRHGGSSAAASMRCMQHPGTWGLT